jgi:hypothetical protein
MISENPNVRTAESSQTEHPMLRESENPHHKTFSNKKNDGT